jgi:2-polyprenyl-3-methyl-5-hydroxy-6-metoxy-1,4-benzoquinol methylase
MQRVDCPFCGSGRRIKLFETEDLNWKVSGNFTIVKCMACGTVYLSPAPEEKEFKKYYPEKYYTRASGNVRVTEAHRLSLEKNHSDRAHILERIVKRGKVLDVGCGDGYFIAFLRKRGWDSWGVELSETACRYAINELQHEKDKVLCGDFLKISLPGNYFDLITLFDVLEHMPNPATVLKRCSELLKPGGGIFIQVPNFNSAGRRIFGKYWIHIDAPRHLTHFTPASLRLFMKGWEIMSEKTASNLRQKDILGYSDSLRHFIKHLLSSATKSPASTPQDERNSESPFRNPFVSLERMAFKAAAAAADAVDLGELVQLHARKRT